MRPDLVHLAPSARCFRGACGRCDTPLFGSGSRTAIRWQALASWLADVLLVERDHVGVAMRSAERVSAGWELANLRLSPAPPRPPSQAATITHRSRGPRDPRRQASSASRCRSASRRGSSASSASSASSSPRRQHQRSTLSSTACPDRVDIGCVWNGELMKATPSARWGSGWKITRSKSLFLRPRRFDGGVSL